MKDRFFLPPAWRKGAALIIALAFLLLISAIVLAFFASARNDQRNASTYASAQDTLNLADTAVNIVMSQIHDATIAGPTGTTGTNVGAVDWASQPGMIRAYGSNGALIHAFKLYSSSDMAPTTFGANEINAELSGMTYWNQEPAQYVDLNAPAVVPRADPTNPFVTGTETVFPIADPRAAATGSNGQPIVEGFGYSGTAGATTIPGVVTSSTESDSQRLPMPVEWLYVLRDGSIIAPQPVTGATNVATFASASGTASQSNPIVGRIAFWADDDTSKLNINTASEGTYWSVPASSTYADSRMSISMPVQGEFQRMAGHPSTTCLSVALGALLPSPEAVIGTSGTSIINNPNFSSYIGASGSAYYQRFVDYYNLTPRITGSLTDTTSQAGIRRTSACNGTDEPASWGTSDPNWVSDIGKTPPGLPITPDTDRLYSTTDELLFAVPSTSATGRALNNAAITATELAHRDFFLTAQSRAPETTLFGTPRVCLWPSNTIYTGTTPGSTPLPNSQQPDRTAMDQLINFCATTGSSSSGTPFTYSFQRGIASVSGTALTQATDANSLSTNGLGPSTIQGNGVAQPADEPLADSSLSRNLNLINYLRYLTSNPIPGFGGKFSTKWGTLGADRAIAQAFDISRTAQADYVQNGTVVSGSNNSTVAYRYAADLMNPRRELLAANQGNDYAAGVRGYVVPAQLSDNPLANGAGCNLSISEFDLVFMASEVANVYTAPVVLSGTTWTGQEIFSGTSTSTTPTYNPPLPNNLTALTSGTANYQQTTKVRAFLLMQPFTPNPTAQDWAPGGRIQILNGNNLMLNGSPLLSSSAETRFGGVGSHNLYNGNYSFPNTQYLFTYPNYLDPYTTPNAGTNGQHDITTMYGGSVENAPGSCTRLKYPLSPNDPSYAPNVDALYPFVSTDIPITSGSTTMNFTGGTITVKMRNWRGDATYQTMTINFPSPKSPIAVPQVVDSGMQYYLTASYYAKTTPPNAGTPISSFIDSSGLANLQSKGADSLALYKRLRGTCVSADYEENLIQPGDVVLGVGINNEQYNGQTNSTLGDFRLVALQPVITVTATSSWFTPVRNYGLCTAQFSGSATTLSGTSDPRGLGRFAENLRYDGDLKDQAQTYGYGWRINGQFNSWKPRGGSGDTVTENLAQVSGGISIFARPITPVNMPTNGALMSSGILGDWGSGMGQNDDGAVFMRPDDGSTSFEYGGYYGDGASNQSQRRVDSGADYGPNRAIPSAGVLGSIMTTDNNGNYQGWQSLLINPVPAGGSKHPGFASPPDHLFLDDFWMPVVQPYAISDPLSTAGKVNLNTQLMPFAYIERTTALRGVLKPIMISAIDKTYPNSPPSGDSNNDQYSYKYGVTGNNDGGSGGYYLIPNSIRYDLNRDQTIASFEQRFGGGLTGLALSGSIYQSASEVCTVPLIPSDTTYGNITPSNISTWWSNKQFTSATLRDQPYVAMLSRVTTRSNTYTVHYRVQSLRQLPASGRNWQQWVEGQDKVLGEYRGATEIERYLDPNEPGIPDYAGSAGTTAPATSISNLPSIDTFYRFRILSTRQFSP